MPASGVRLVNSSLAGGVAEFDALGTLVEANVYQGQALPGQWCLSPDGVYLYGDSRNPDSTAGPTRIATADLAILGGNRVLTQFTNSNGFGAVGIAVRADNSYVVGQLKDVVLFLTDEQEVVLYDSAGAFVAVVPMTMTAPPPAESYGVLALALLPDDTTLLGIQKNTFDPTVIHRSDINSLTASADFASLAGFSYDIHPLPDSGALVCNRGDVVRLDAAGTEVWRTTSTYNGLGQRIAPWAWLGCYPDPDGESFWASSGAAYAPPPYSEAVIGLFDLATGEMQSYFSVNDNQSIAAIGLFGGVVADGHHLRTMVAALY